MQKNANSRIPCSFSQIKLLILWCVPTPNLYASMSSFIATDDTCKLPVGGEI